VDSKERQPEPMGATSLAIGPRTGVSLLVVISLLCATVGSLSALMTDRVDVASNLAALDVMANAAKQAGAANAVKISQLERDFRTYLGEINLSLGRIEGIVEGMANGGGNVGSQ